MGKKKRKNEKREVFHVEVITKARVLAEGGGWEYFVKWAGYSSDADSWEPEENVRECQRLLKSFWTHVGIDNDDYPPGYVFEAGPNWIADERKYFADQYSYQQKEEKRRHEKVATKTENEQTKKLNRSDSNKMRTSAVFKGKGKMKTIIISDSDESIDEPLMKIKIPPQKRKIPPADDSSSPPPSITKPPRKVPKTSSSLPTNDSSNSISSKGKQKEPPKSSGSRQTVSSPTSLFSDSPSPKSNPPLAPAASNPLYKISSSAGLPKRQNEPLVKLLPMEDVVTGGSSLSTKQRITQGSLTEKSKPKVPVPPTKSLPNINFKKKPSASGSTNRVREPEAALFQLEQLSSPEILNVQLDTSLLDHRPVTSPENIVSLLDYDPDPFASFNPHEPDISPILHAQTLPAIQPPVQTQSDNLTEADVFLSSIKPPNQEPQPRRIPQLNKPAALPRIQKKWKWTGELFVDVDQDKAEKLCEITLTDVTDYLPEGLRLNILFSTLDSIRLGKLHEVFYLDLILAACKPSEQVAKVVPHDEKDASVLRGLISHMHAQNQVAFMSLFQDDFCVAILLVFPSSIKDLCHRFKVPKDMQQCGALLATLIPWTASAAQKTKEWRKPYDGMNLNRSTHDILGVCDKRDILRSNPNYCRALRTLNFPKNVHDYMSLPKRPYCVWCTGGDGTTAEPGLETTWLVSVLNQCGAKNLGLKADVRIVFVHVGAMKTLHSLPALVERRSRRSEVQFYMYGTHETVAPERWGIREIFPLGGIVTFTPSAIVDDPISVYKLIGQLAEHPLWACYVLPSVVGMVSRLSHGSEDPLSLFDKGEFGYDNLLMLIEQGKLDLLQARNPVGDQDLTDSWIRERLRLIPAQTRGLLGECMNEFIESYSNRQESEWTSTIETEISNDLGNMQLQPAMMDTFRRYVVIKAPRDDHISWNRDGFEWVPLSKFDFRDDYFIQPEENGAK